MNSNSPFYYPVALHDGENIITLLAPTVEDLPILPEVPVVLLSHGRGARQQGLYAYKGRCWTLVLPLHEVSRSIIRGDVLSVYSNLLKPMDAPIGAFVWANGGSYKLPKLAPGKVVYLVQTPPSSAGGGAVNSVNGQTGTVTLNAANLPGLSKIAMTAAYADLVGAPILADVAKTGSYKDLTDAPGQFVLGAATTTALGGVSVPASGNLALTIGGALSISAETMNTINGKLGSVQSAGTGTSLVQSSASGVASIKSLTGAGTITITEDAQGNVTLTGAAGTYVLPNASASTLGGVRVGTGLAVSGTGVLSLNLPTATDAVVGGVRVGAGLSIDPATGILSATAVPYTLVAATTTTLGGVSVGAGLSVNAAGALSATPYTLVAATAGALGGIRVGTGLTIDGSGILSVSGGAYTLPNASTTVLGGVRVGTNLSIDAAGVLSAAMYSLPAASAAVRGGVRVGAGLAIDANGILSAVAGEQYTLPVATATVLGGVKVGANLTATADGTLSAPAPYSLPTATTTTVGGVSVGAGLSINAQGVLSAVAGEAYTLPAATNSVLGGVIAGSGLAITAAGVLSVTPVSPVIASAAALGSVRIGSGLTIDAAGILSAEASTPYSLPVATASVLGGVKAGSNVTIAADGTLSTAAPYTLPAATTTTRGGVTVGSGLTVDAQGVLSASAPAQVIATAAALGSIRVGSGLSIDSATGVLSVSASTGGVTSFNTRSGAVTLTLADVTTALTYTPLAVSGGTMTGAFNEAPVASFGSGGTTTIGARPANTVSVSGNATIVAFDSIAAGAVRRVIFEGTPTLVHNATSLILPTSANIAVAAGDTAEFVSLGGGNWRCLSYDRVNGTPLAGGGSAYTAGTGLTLTGSTFALANSGATAGTFKSVTVDAMGRVTAGTNPTTLAGYGITDAATTAGFTMAGALNEAPPVSLAAAATTNIANAASNNINVTGTGSITSFGIAPVGSVRRLIFASTPTLFHNVGGGIMLPGAANIVVAAGDVAEFISTASGTWTCISYTRANGTPIAGGGTAYTAGTGLTLTGSAFSITPTGVAAGTFRSVTVDATGRVTAGTNPTTLAGYGITDAATTAGFTLTGALNDAPFVSMAATTTMNINSAASNNITITGNSTIATFTPTNPPGVTRRLRFTGTPVLGNNLQFPGSANIQVAPGDIAEMISLGDANGWRCYNYTRADGTPLVTSNTFNGSATEVALKVKNIVETVQVSGGAPTGLRTFDANAGTVLFTTAAATAAWTLNLRHSSTTALNAALAVGDSITMTHLATQGATPFLLSGVQVDGTTQTIRWQGETPSAGNANAIDSYNFTVIKTAESTFTVLGTMSKFG